MRGKGVAEKPLTDPLIVAEEGGPSEACKSKDVTQPMVVEHEGLTDAQVAELRREWGENALPEKRKSKLVLLLLAFTTPMALLIWVGALAELTVGLLKQAEGRQGVSGPTEDLVDFGVLLLLQVMNALVG